MANTRKQPAKPKIKQPAEIETEIGIIGGSGLYAMPGLARVREVRVTTPFGPPSDAFVLGELEGRQVAFLARHGRGHVLLPGEINFRANIYGMKKLGVERIISVSAVGSLREEFKPLDMVIPSQFFDRTAGRVSTFFGDGIAVHIGFSDPVCSGVQDALAFACAETGVGYYRGGTYVCMEGPAFSTQAESNAYRAWGMDLIGMTNLQEAKLAREAEICYATLAMVTDYDCWHPSHDAVTVHQVIECLNRNVENAQKIIGAAVEALPKDRSCKCGSALAHAIITDRSKIPAATRKRLDLLIGKYL
ncbi:MAG TPA: S-methyl-5'-thioadenosine phosphorylase [Terriglobia bacterium]|nr:S-methyl-5'-thioadenosine phosphorylase [Terriglobia bacterium]